MATLEEVIDAVRVGFLHDTGGTGIDWRVEDRTCRHSNVELARYANLAVYEVAKRVNNSWSTVEVEVQASTTLLPNANVVTLPTRRLDRVDTHLVELQEAGGDAVSSPLCIDDLYKENSNWSLAKRYPNNLAWTIIGDEVEIIGMKPDTLYLFTQTWNVYPTALAWPLDKASSFLVDESYVHALYYYICYLAYMRDDPDVLDIGRSEEFFQKFTRQVGGEDNMYVKRRRNERDRRPTADYWGTAPTRVGSSRDYYNH